MRMYEFMLVVVLLFAGAAQAVKTVSPLTDKGWVQAQQDLVGRIGPSAEEAAGPEVQTFETTNSSDGVLQPMLGVYPGFSETPFDDPAAPLMREGEGASEQSQGGLVDGIDSTANWTSGPQWHADPAKYPEAGFVNADARADLPAFTEVDWTSTPLPTADGTSVMEIIVFPALAFVALILALTLLVLRIRRRRSVNPPQLLLHV